MAEKEGLYPITKDDLEKHLYKVDQHMESIDKGGSERYNLFNLVREIGGSKNMMAKEVQDTMEAVRQGLALYYEMYATLEDRINEMETHIPEDEKQLFLGSYSMFAAGSYISYKLDLILGEKEPFKYPRKENYFNFTFKKDDVLNLTLAKYHGPINTAKRKKKLKEGSDLPAASVDFFKFLRDEALAKKPEFEQELIKLVEKAEFRVADEFTISGFEATYEEKAKAKVQFVPLLPHQVAGNVLAKQEMLRDMDRIALFDLIAQKSIRC